MEDKKVGGSVAELFMFLEVMMVIGSFYYLMMHFVEGPSLGLGAFLIMLTGVSVVGIIAAILLRNNPKASPKVDTLFKVSGGMLAVVLVVFLVLSVTRG